MTEENPEPKKPVMRVKKSSFKSFLFLIFIFIAGMAVQRYVIAPGVIIDDTEIKIEALTYLNQMVTPGNTIEIATVSEQSGVYQLDLLINGGPYVSYITKDAELLFVEGIKTDEIVQPQTPVSVEVPKTDRPEVDLYIFSYCPAGVSTQFTYAILAQEMQDFADFNVKFFSHMHGEYEKQQNMFQECYQKMYPFEYWNYGIEFLGTVYEDCSKVRTVECDKERTEYYTSFDFNTSEIYDCVEEFGEDLYAQDIADAQALGLGYSPSLVINGVYIENYDRSAEGIKNKICEAFTEQPAICDEVLTSQDTTVTGQC